MELIKMSPLHFQFQAGAPCLAASTSLSVSPFLHAHIAEDVWAVSNLASPLVLSLKAGSVRHWRVLMHCSFSSFSRSGGIS